MLNLRNFSCSMLVPRCLKRVLSELQPFKAIGNYMGSMQKWSCFCLNDCMCIISYDLVIFRSKTQTTFGAQINTDSKTNKHRKR